MFVSGDVLKINYGAFDHYGIYTENGTVIHNSKKNKKVEETSIERFSENNKILVSSIKSENPALTVQTARKYLNIPYSLFSDNCEHFVRMSCGLVKESTQVIRRLSMSIQN